MSLLERFEEIGKDVEQSWRGIPGLFTPRSTRRHSRLASLALAVALPFAALVISHWSEPVAGHTSYQLFLGAVALSALYNGTRDGLLSLAISGFLKYWFFLAPLAIDRQSAVIRLILFLMLGFLIAWLGGRLRSKEQHLNAILKFVGDAVAITNRRKQIIFLNPAAESLTGWSREEATGRPFTEVVPLLVEEDGESIHDEVERAFREGRAVNSLAPMLLRNRKGCITAVEESIAPIRDAEGKITGSVAILHDISESKTLEADLRITRKIRALSRLTGPLIHDFSNLLTVLGGHAELLRSKLELLNRPDLENSAVEITRAAEHATSLARQLIVLNGGAATRRERIDLNVLITDMRKALYTILGDYITLTVSPEKKLWLVEASPEQLEQIVVNLVANARDAMPKGGSLLIRTRNVYLPDQAGARRPYVLLEVRDDGCGMDKTTRSKIFEPYFSTKPNSEGAGLGLSVVHSVVVQYQGRITIESEPGEGTSVCVYVPRFVDSRSAAPGPRFAAPLTTISLRLLSTVLVVETTDSVRELIACTLRTHGFFVLEAANGPEALEIASNNLNHLKLIIMELATPGIAGPEIATRLRLLRQDLKVLYISSSPKFAEWGNNGGNANRAVLFKPFSPGDLLAKVNWLLKANSSELET